MTLTLHRKLLEEIIEIQNNYKTLDDLALWFQNNFTDQQSVEIWKKRLQFMDIYREGFPDLTFEINNNWSLEVDNKAYSLLKVTGTNTGKFIGIDPTNKRITVYWHFRTMYIEGKFSYGIIHTASSHVLSAMGINTDKIVSETMSNKIQNYIDLLDKSGYL